MFEPPWCFCQSILSNRSPPLLLRGLCSSSNLRSNDFTRGVWYTPQQLTSDVQNIFYVGGMSTRIEYNKPMMRWVLRDVPSNTSAVTLTRRNTYVLGKHNWTIKDDCQRCREEKGQGLKEYRTELKLSGCKQGFVFAYGGHMNPTNDGEFTCNNGQCVSMKCRCDQFPHCDEEGCDLLTLRRGYNKIVPPFTSTKSDDKIIPIAVYVSLRLLRVIDINEDENTIDFAKDCLLTCQEQACTRITWLFVRSFVTMLKSPIKQNNGCCLPYSDHIHGCYTFPDQTRP